MDLVEESGHVPLTALMKPSSSSSSQSDDAYTEARGGLTFAWSGGKALVAHLGVFVAIALAIHLFGFYLFQVVYPVSSRVEPVPNRVRVLDPSQPAVAALMRQIEDRLILLNPASSDSEARVSLEDFSVAFRPSFIDRELGFRPIPLSGMIDREGGPELVLPPLAQLDIAESPLRMWRIGGGLSDRPVRRPEALDEAIANFGFKGETRVRLSLSVDRRGDLRSVRPTADEAYPRIDELVITVRTHLRFERAAGPPGEEESSEWQQGWLEIGR